ncbi:response regulator [Natronococcus sp.]|uniref:hybrid sensor histidine kinase/response regulator n=1 Tax=Natronococcus sp. TaxID=35747 RepID=UPI003A4E654A
MDGDQAALDRTVAALERGSEATTVEATSDPEAALERVRGGEYDCLVCEYELPGPNGIELLEAVRRFDPEQPVILFTGSGSEAVASEAIANDVTDYVRKDDARRHERLAEGIERAVVRRREGRSRERSNEALEAFADVVVHDLRGSLTAAAGFLALAREDGESCPFLEEVDTAHGRMEEILEDLLALARAGDVADELEPVSVAAAAEAGWPLPPDAEATLEMRVPATLRALADRDRFVRFFERVFDALLEGEASRPRGVTVGALDGGFFIEGEGIDGSSAPVSSVFTHSKSGHDGRNDLGHRIAGAIADAHGWTLSVVDGGKRLEITDVDAV